MSSALKETTEKISWAKKKRNRLEVQIPQVQLDFKYL
jgi:hypothetical protein